ncbi:MAG: pyridoxamine 5'-phosphate oxidase family protein [Bacteroidota bacterium]
MQIQTLKQLRALYATPSKRAKGKEMTQLDVHAKNFLSISPFFMLSTYGKEGLADASPRGGKPGFVQILDDQRLIIPDSKGNNRLDSLSNIVETGQVGMLFLVPGMDETLRVNGKAHLSTDLALLDLFPHEQNPPKVAIVVEVESVFLHCAKALMRSQLWAPEVQIDRSSFPTIGQMLKDQLGGPEAPESQEEMVKRYQKDL